jgi:hypothetical protein
MKFLSIYTPDARTAATAHTKEHMAAMGKLMEESAKSGELVATGGLLPISKGGAHVRSSGGKITVTDGPFAEAKELVAGWAILQYNSREEAIEGVKRFIRVAGDGEVDLRQIMDGPPEAA